MSATVGRATCEMKARSLRVACALLLLLLVGGLTSLAYASPPDPSWIRGIYDDDDYDNVIVMITSTTAATAPVLVMDLRLIPPLAGWAAPHTDDPVPTLPFSRLQSRSPPTS
jgi:hypothetical protein